jgi:hypothetical protein
MSYRRADKVREASMPKLEPDDEEAKSTVELVTLDIDQFTHGVGTGNAQAFPDVDSALAYAMKELTKDERDCSWIRDGKNVRPLGDTIRSAEAHSGEPFQSHAITSPGMKQAKDRGN